jgi:hypothetical protein
MVLEERQDFHVIPLLSLLAQYIGNFPFRFQVVIDGEK